MINDCTAIILAGGESKRMGQDKASIFLDGKTLLERALRQLSPLFEHIMVSVREPKEGISFPQICDGTNERAPMIGIHQALQTVTTSWVFVMAVDMPFVSANLMLGLASLRSNQQAIVPKVAGHLQPLCAYYSKGCTSAMRQQINNGNRSLKRLIEGFDALIVCQEDIEKFDKACISFLDLDCLDDLKNAENLVTIQHNAIR